MPVYKNSFRRKKSLKFVLFQSLFCLISSSKFFNKIAILSSLASILCDTTIKRTLKWFILAKITQNVDFINLNNVSYFQSIWVSLNDILFSEMFPILLVTYLMNGCKFEDLHTIQIVILLYR